MRHSLTYHFKVKHDFDIGNDNALSALLSNGEPTKVSDDLPVEVQDSDKQRKFNFE